MNKKLQVFVSSTYTDLIEERQTAVEAILDAGHIPAGMELFKAGKSQMQTIQRWIDESDVYMLILGGRYGSIEEESDLSYIELEYRYALSKNIPVFAIILDESFLFTKAASKGKDAIFEKDNIDKYNDFKEFVLTTIVKFVDNLDKINSTIQSQLNYFLNSKEYILNGWIRKPLINIHKNKNCTLSVILNRSQESHIALENIKNAINSLYIHETIKINYIDTITESGDFKPQLLESNIIIFDLSKINDKTLFYLGYITSLSKDYIIICHERKYVEAIHIVSYCDYIYDVLLYGSSLPLNLEFVYKLQDLLKELSLNQYF